MMMDFEEVYVIQEEVQHA